MTQVQYTRIRDILRDENYHPVTPVTDAEMAKYSIRLRKLLQLYKAEEVGDAPASMLLTTHLAAIPEAHQLWMYSKAFPTKTHETMPGVTISEFADAIFKAFEIHRPALLPQVQKLAPLTFYTSREANYNNVGLLATHITNIAAVSAPLDPVERQPLTYAVIALLPTDVAEFLEDVATRPLRELPFSSIIELLLALCKCERQPDPGYHCQSKMPDSIDIALRGGFSLTLELTPYRVRSRTREILGYVDEPPTPDMPWYDAVASGPAHPKRSSASAAAAGAGDSTVAARQSRDQPKAHRCGDWNNGSCARGDACRFRHGSINDLCRFGEECRDKENCRARHPKSRSK